MLKNIKKTFYFQKTLINNQNKIIYLKNKNLTIILDYVGIIFFIYNGKSFLKLQILREMVGFKFGEFIFTRKRHIYKKKKKKK